MMRVRLLPLVLLAVLTAAGPAGALVAAVDRNYPPHEWWEAGNAQGFNAEVLRAVARELGEPLAFRPYVWAEVERALDRGEVDLSCMARTPGRAERYALTRTPILPLELAIFVREGTAGIPDLSALAHRTVAVEENDIGHRVLRERCPEAVAVVVPDQAEALRLLAAGEVTAYLGNRHTGPYLIERLGLRGIHTIGEPVPVGERVIALPKGQTALRDRVDQALRRLTADGTLERLREKWFGRPAVSTRDWRPVLRSIAAGAALVLLALGALVLWNRSLRREVRRRTAELRASEERYRALLDTALEAVLVADLETGEILYANRPTERLLGLSRAEILGRRVQDLVMDDDRERVRQSFEEVAADRRGALPRSYVVARPDGERRVVEAVSSPMEYQGRPAALVYARDVTEREENRRRAEQADRLRSVGRLAGGVAHEFNNLLAAVLGHAELGELETADPSARRRFRAVAQAAQRGGEIARQLLAYSRQQPLRPRTVDLCAEVRQAVEFLRPLLPRNIELRVECEPESVWTRVDPARLQEALVNLATNARDAMPQGGRLLVEVDRVDLDGAYTRNHRDLEPGPYARITVSDTGEGIPPEVLPHVFEPFFTTKPVGKGTGLGLSTVHGFVKQSRGHVHVYSEPGVGTTVRLYLPEAPPADQAGEAAEPDEPSETPARTAAEVWVVEDEPAVREMLCEFLESQGYRPLGFASGEAALQALDGRRPDAAVVDLVLEGRSGREVGVALREGVPGLPLVYISGYSESFARAEGLLEEGAAFLTKPFRVADLHRVLLAALEAKGEHTGNG
ncbi:transporter substrate-binding domain-containing protein [Deferrisoma palaeochoriense]